MLPAFVTGNLTSLLVIGFGAGIFLFFKGFQVYREYRLLADTPEEPIRSIPMGLVRVHGKARGEKTVISPVTRSSCFFYKVVIEKYVRDKNSARWTHFKTDCTGIPFYLEDSTGKVLVDATGAECDLIQSGKRETGGLVGRGWGKLLSGIDAPSPAETASGGSGTTASKTETLAPTLGSQPADHDLVAYVDCLTSLGPSSQSSLSETVGNLAGFSLGGGLGFNLGGSVDGRYRLTEYCILPGHWYDVTGTCAENPSPQDEHDRNMILKGTNEPTFLISWRSAKAVETTLRNRAALSVFGGAALSLACLAGLLVKFGWLGWL